MLVLRRHVKQVYEIMKTYETHRNKLLNSGNRSMLIAEINKQLKYFQNKTYGKFTEEFYTLEELDLIAKKKRSVEENGK